MTNNTLPEFILFFFSNRITLSILSFSFICLKLFLGWKKDSVIRRQFVCYFDCVVFLFQRDHSIFMFDKCEKHDIVWALWFVWKGVCVCVQKPLEQCKVLNTNNKLWQMPNNIWIVLWSVSKLAVCHGHAQLAIWNYTRVFVLQWWQWWWRWQSIVINICPKVYRPFFVVHQTPFYRFIAVFCSNQFDLFLFFSLLTLHFRFFVLFKRWQNQKSCVCML